MSYATTKFESITEAIQQKIFPVKELSNSQQQIQNDFENMMSAFLEKFKSTNDFHIKMQILTSLPDSWSVNKICNMFGCSRYHAEKSKELRQKRGPLSTFDRNQKDSFSESEQKVVADFYNNDAISRMMPGMRDCKIIQNQNEKIYVQRKLVLYTLREAHQLFQMDHPETKSGI